jgi:S1-C subfamily serine protease
MNKIVIVASIAIAIIGIYYLIQSDIQEKRDTINQLPLSNNNASGELLEPLTLPELFDYVKNSVVKISINTNMGEGVGSGFVYSEQGYIITNNHVVDNAKRITVTFSDGMSYEADLIGRDPFTDLAVIKINADLSNIKPLRLGNSSSLRVGEQVAAIGNPFGLSSSMTSGIISQLGRLLDVPNGGGFVIPDVIQTDAAINPGNSGGPLLNMRGEVIGVNTAIISRTGEFAGIGFAIPSNTVKKVVPILINEGKYKHPWLGVSGSDLTPQLAKQMNIKDTKGFLIMSVVKGSPAEKAGLRGGDKEVTIDGKTYLINGDIIIKIDNVVVRGISDILIYLQREKSVGDEVVLTIIREGNIIEKRATLLERPDILESP